jgi:hypothetical protein
MLSFNRYFQPEELPLTPFEQYMQSEFISNPPANLNHTGSAVIPLFETRGAQLTLSRALKNVLDMPWFGLLEKWAGSVCLLHYATEWQWPAESRAACSPDAHHFEWGALTHGSAARPDDRRRQYSAQEKDDSRKNAHRGVAPSIANNWSVCPIRVAERLLNDSVTAQMDRWLAANAPDLSILVYKGDIRDAENQSYLKGDASSPFKGFPIDPRGADATMYNWALTIFEARMREATKKLARRGFSLEAPPPFLSPDCFLASAPDGFLVV